MSFDLDSLLDLPYFVILSKHYKNMNNNNSENRGDDEVSLPVDTLKILNEFLREKVERERQQEESIRQKCSNGVNFDENWQLSQFWYNEKTKSDLTKICQNIAGPDKRIGLLSCPSLYPAIKSVHDNVKIFEYDNRFSSYGDDFIFYDFNEAENTNYLVDYSKSFDVIIADPPFLSEECIQKISCLIKRLMNDGTKIIFCSGVMVELWVKEYLGLERCSYMPQHERNLGNEFISYANFNLDEYL